MAPIPGLRDCPPESLISYPRRAPRASRRGTPGIPRRAPPGRRRRKTAPGPRARRAEAGPTSAAREMANSFPQTPRFISPRRGCWVAPVRDARVLQGRTQPRGGAARGRAAPRSRARGCGRRGGRRRRRRGCRRARWVIMLIGYDELVGGCDDLLAVVGGSRRRSPVSSGRRTRGRVRVRGEVRGREIRGGERAAHG